MIKLKRVLGVFIVTFMLMVIGAVSVSAGLSANFTNFVVKAYSNNTELGTYRVSYTTSKGQVKLTAMEMDKAVFSASYFNTTNSSWTSISGQTFYDSIGEVKNISYGANRAAGTQVKIKVKNNNWTNATRKISGYYYVNGDAS